MHHWRGSQFFSNFYTVVSFLCHVHKKNWFGLYQILKKYPPGCGLINSSSPISLLLARACSSKRFIPFFSSHLYSYGTFLSFSYATQTFFRSPPLLCSASLFVLQTSQPKEARNVALSSLSIWADSVELPSSKVRASNEAINKSTALTGLSTLFVLDDVSILEFFSCLRVREVGPVFSVF